MNSIIVVTNMQNRNIINKKVGCGYYDEMSQKKKRKGHESK
jgi:hypothetical protein